MARLGSMSIVTFVLGSLLGAPTTGGAQARFPEREVTGRTIVSKREPVARLRFATPFSYAGGQRFILNRSADAEQHFFVDADSSGLIRRMYWIQFERRLSGADEPYHYALEDTIVIGDLTFIADTKVFADYADTVLRRDSLEDSDQARAGWFLRKKGLRPPAAAVRARMFHLPDSAARSELMIIYIEAVSPADTHGRSLPAEARARAEWPDLAARIIRNAQLGLTIER